jgi:TonB family protein
MGRPPRRDGGDTRLRRSRAGIAALATAFALAAGHGSVGAQAPGITLVDLPIPAYPPIAGAAGVSGDVRVTVNVRPDCTVASAVVAGVDDPATPATETFFTAPALEAARGARFTCDGVPAAAHAYTLVFAFRFAPAIGRAEGQVDPEITSISRDRSRILIVAEMPYAGEGPAARRGPARTARCLWLWHCERFERDDEPGEPELALAGVTAPEYPADAIAARASADVEVIVGVQPDGRVAAAEIGTSRDLAGSTPELRSSFERAALAAAREAGFVCWRCRGGRLSYSIVYEFRFAGVLTILDRGYGMEEFSSSSTQAIIAVHADVPALDAALTVEAERLPAACRPAPSQPASGEPSFPKNPWTSEDRQLIARVRARMTGRTDTDLAPRYELQLAEGVRQAYVNRYMDEGGAPVAVYGLLFGDTNDARAFAELATAGGAHAFVVHRTIVAALRERRPCADALSGLLETRAKPIATR